MKLKTKLKPVHAFLSLAIIGLVATAFFLGQKTAKVKTPPNPPLAFLQESFNLIQENYWDTLEDQDLINIYLASARKFGDAPQLVNAESKDELFKLLEKVVNQDNAPTIVDAVLQNLQPLGRSKLYTQKLAKDLSNTVSNIDPTTDHYQSLEV
ncbi:hypothetical protein KKB06_03120, partial [Patescibacteria group bacterium]|nr:hypothetical protein [Patescibacteria group bacterium]